MYFALVNYTKNLIDAWGKKGDNCFLIVVDSCIFDTVT